MEEVVLYSKKEKLNTRDTKPLEKGGYILVMSTRNTLIPMQL
jgi:hypothetical protein